MKGICSECFDEYKLDRERVRVHDRPGGAFECPGSLRLALDDEDVRTARILDLIGRSASVGNTSRMSLKNERRIARTIYYNLKKAQVIA